MVGVISCLRQVNKSLKLASLSYLSRNAYMHEKAKQADFDHILQPQQYPHGMDCRWVIVGPPGHIIKLTWMSFNLEESHTCLYDYLAVYDNTTIPGTGRQIEWILIFSTYETSSPTLMKFLLWRWSCGPVLWQRHPTRHDQHRKYALSAI